MTPPLNSLAGKARAAATQPLLRALSAFQQGRAADCARLCETLLAKRAKEPGALHLLGAARLRLGDSEGALSALRQAARYDPRNAEIHSNLGAALRAAGDAAAAVEALRRAVALNPNAGPAHYNLGNALAALGRHEDAVAAYRKAVTLAPADAGTHNNLGLALTALGRHDEAIAAWRRSVAVEPAQRDAYLNLGRTMRANGHPEAALSHFDAGLAANPDDPDLRIERGVALHELGRTEQAIAALRQVVDRHPDRVDARINLGSALCLAGRMAEGTAEFDAVLAISPDSADALSSLGAALGTSGDADRAEDALARALALDPNHADALNNMGELLRDRGYFEAAEGYYSRALAVAPHHPEAEFGHAAVSLALGRFAAGWRSFLGRPSMTGRSGYHRATLPESMIGTTMLVDGDQGLGDDIFFLRFLPQIKRRGAQLCYRPDSRLADMFTRARIADRILSGDEPAERTDLHISVGDLPYLLDHGDASPLPPTIALTALPERVAAARARLAALGPPPYLGLSWRAGTSGRRKALFKDVPWAALAASLRDLPCTWVALQRAPEPDEIDAVSAALRAPLHDLTALNGDLESMLAVLSLLDDYVCVSNTNVHLRAACGGSCRILVPNPPEFRWMAAGDESPWFPGMPLYRETPDGGWDAAFARLRRDLAAALAP